MPVKLMALFCAVAGANLYGGDQTKSAAKRYDAFELMLLTRSTAAAAAAAVMRALINRVRLKHDAYDVQ